MKDYRREALEWHAKRPELPVSVFACQFPGQYADAAVAIRVVKTLANAGTEEDTMALSVEQQLELKQAEHNRTVQDLLKTVELLDYYRSQITQTNGSRAKPPAGYWIKNSAQSIWGIVSDGDLLPKGKTDVYEEAVEACWAHYDKLHDNRHIKHPRPSTEHIPEKTKRAAKKEAEVDLTDLADEPEDPPVRRRRRRVAND